MNKIEKSIKINNIKEINDSFSLCCLDNIFTVFKFINKSLYLTYATRNKSIIIYNLSDDIKLCEIKKAHKEYITNFRHHSDKKNKRDLVISISTQDNNIKLWNINNLECLMDINNIYNEGYLNSACFLEDENTNNIFVIASNFNFNSHKEIKVFDLQGKEIKEIKNSNDKTYIILSYFDEITKKNYIITGNMGSIKSFDFQENKIYNKFCDESKRPHFSLLFHKRKNKQILNLIESCYDGHIRIWNFHTNELLNKIKISKGINSISLFLEDFIFISCCDKTIKLLNLKNEEIQEFYGINKDIISLLIIRHPSSNCYHLITEGFEEDPIAIYNITF